MTRLPGSITRTPKARWSHPGVRRRDPVPADQTGATGPGRVEAERPDPVAVLGVQHHRPLGIEHVHPQAWPVLSELLDVADLPVLKLRQDLVDAVHVEAEEVLDPVVGVDASLAASHLHQPWPDRRGRRVDGDRTGGEESRGPRAGRRPAWSGPTSSALPPQVRQGVRPMRR